MKLYRFTLMIALFFSISATSLMAQSIKKSKQQTIELKSYTSHQLKVANTPKEITMTFIKNVGDIETEYWLTLEQTTKHDSVMSIVKENFSQLSIDTGKGIQLFDLTKAKSYNYVGWILGKSTYTERISLKITQESIEKLINGEFFAYTLTLKSNSPAPIKIEGKNWIKLQAALQKLLNS